MRIEEVKHCFKIADVELNTSRKSSDRLKFSYLKNIIDEYQKPLGQEILTQNVPRVYFLVVDGEIKKIGGSESKGGIKKTLEIYQDGGLNGQPSNRSIGIWWHLFHEVEKNKKVEIYMNYQENFLVEIKGLFKKEQKKASISYKHIEDLCLQNFFSIENKYPEWNYQENHQKWPEEVDELVMITKMNKGKRKDTGKVLDFSKKLKEKFPNSRVKRNYE